MKLVCLDLEGVLTPEIWIGVAERTGIDELRRTTRDEPDYDVLMGRRLAILDAHGLTLPDIQDVIRGLAPLPGARTFLDELRAAHPVVLLSDTYEQFAGPLLEKLGHPLLLCNTLQVAADGRIVGYTLRQRDGKRHAVEAFVGLGFEVAAVGDSYNDTTMLAAAHRGFLFRPPSNVAAEFPGYPVTTAYRDLAAQLGAYLSG